MKKLILFCIAISGLFTSGISAKCINPIVGDQSFIMKFGQAPNDATDDHLRIQIHLEYAEFVLRSRDVSGMNQEQIDKRNHLLDLLHAYWTRGIFPRNDDHTDERKPCFIDHEGTICAVGYLVEQTSGHEVAELISERFLYGEILNMNDPVVINWIEQCGLSREECAIIQPSYGPRFVREPQISYGASYRIADNFYHSFGIYSLKYHGGGMRSFGHGELISSAGLRFDLLNSKNFSLGFRYAKYIGRQRTKHASIGIMPECFRYGGHWGMNLKPEFELSKTWKFLEIGLGYSYAIPMISGNDYGAGRHDVGLRIGVNLADLPRIRIPKKPKEENTDDKPDALK